MTIGETIRDLRKSYGITQKELADAIGIDDATIRKYESGKLNPKLSTLEKIARAFSVDVNVLTEGNLNATSAMLKLFSVYKSYSGIIKDGKMIQQEIQDGTFDKDQIYLAFDSLRSFMLSWLWVYEEYQNDLQKAESIKDEDERRAYIEEAERRYFMWMYQYPESEPNKEMLQFSSMTDEALDYMGTHPFNDPEHPVTQEDKENAKKDLTAIYDKLKKVPFYGPDRKPKNT